MGVIIVMAAGLALCAVIGTVFMLGINRLIGWVVRRVEQRQDRGAAVRETQGAGRS